jgi:hypothetical protein
LKLLFSLPDCVLGVGELLGVFGTHLIASDIALVLEAQVDAVQRRYGQSAEDGDLIEELVRREPQE